jgi:hypothetical protein
MALAIEQFIHDKLDITQGSFVFRHGIHLGFSVMTAAYAAVPVLARCCMSFIPALSAIRGAAVLIQNDAMLPRQVNRSNSCLKHTFVTGMLSIELVEIFRAPEATRPKKDWVAEADLTAKRKRHRAFSRLKSLLKGTGLLAAGESIHGRAAHRPIGRIGAVSIAKCLN